MAWIMLRPPPWSASFSIKNKGEPTALATAPPDSARVPPAVDMNKLHYYYIIVVYIQSGYSSVSRNRNNLFRGLGLGLGLGLVI